MSSIVLETIMKRLEQSWQLGDLKFHLIEGDLFEVSVDAIVNSEQTDFKLSGNPHTISGQIRRLFGQDIQDDLDSLTGNKTLPPGTVLKTISQGRYSAVFHAGFHHPLVWLDKTEENSHTEHVRIIRHCIREILEDLRGEEIASIAFPLIGCGTFELDPDLLAYEFATEVAQFALLERFSAPKEVHLVVRNPEIIDGVLRAVVQAFIDRIPQLPDSELLSLGVSYLDQFERDSIRSHEPKWLAWMLARYCELLTGYLFYQLATASAPPVAPQNIMELDRPASFGLIRSEASRLAKSNSLMDCKKEWTRFFINMLRRDLEQERRLERINRDRNDIAHGRNFRDPKEIYKDLVDFLSVDEWREMLRNVGSPGVGGLQPWVLECPPDTIDTPTEQRRELGVLERWGAKRWTYLVPHTGVTFKVEFPNLWV